ncbi:YaiI/YqxD family protein [Aliiruegeria sabulilitoris]|uniref:YaiI/YqxD family protein n=1 Tax=Aliiruegeria sabulilitoris TaxID=1510458 RepID=UPI00082BD29F|nr:YaiI/YqxD family protein [Aliiruegeria sabulilitoris]NDR55524.1 YaiI/YqxD family protein [Pseudoruegeria sp. M32A2M]
MTIYIDADACPVKAEAERVATRHKVEMVLVCNGGIRAPDNPLVRVVYVDQGLDVADRWIAEQAGPGDVVVTADIPLAADCIEAGALVLKHDGETLTQRNIANVLAARNLMTELRSADPLGTGGGGRPFSKSDRARFSQALDRVLVRGR